tara:strand:+ start:674 stop:913 length:240 start_codon:yes stop_codon:yes gene_type:complete
LYVSFISSKIFINDTKISGGMMTLKQQKIDFAKNSLDSIFDDTKLVNEILFEYFFKQVKYMNKKEFKQHLIDLNIIEGE